MDMGEIGEALVEGFNKGIVDIDAEDHDSPQMCAEYVNEIYRYMRSLEVWFGSLFDLNNQSPPIFFNSILILEFRHYFTVFLIYNIPFGKFICLQKFCDFLNPNSLLVEKSFCLSQWVKLWLGQRVFASS